VTRLYCGFPQAVNKRVLLVLRPGMAFEAGSRGKRSLVPALVLFGAVSASAPAAQVLVIVPSGADLVAIDRARSAVPAPHTALLVAESERVRVKGGLEMLVDSAFGSAPAADLVVLLPGDAGRAEEAFLAGRKRTARAILLPPGSSAGDRLKATSGGALLFVGGPDSIAAVLEGIAGSPGAEAPPPRSSTPAAPTPRPTPETPAATPTRPPSGRVFDRYFSPSRATPTPTPSPR
jgi:hypothetical protein